MNRYLPFAFLVCAFACGDDSPGACVVDSDCEGETVCMNGNCVGLDAGVAADTSTGDAVTADGSMNDGSSDTGEDVSLTDVGSDTQMDAPAPLEPIGGARFDLPYPVHGAALAGDTTVMIGLDGRQREAERQGVAAGFRGGVVQWSLVLGDTQNDQLFAAATSGDLAIGVGLTRSPTFGVDDILLVAFDGDGVARAAHVGGSARDIAFDVDANDTMIFAVGQQEARPSIWRVNSDFSAASSAALETEGTFFGVRVVGDRVYAVGRTDESDDADSLVAAFSSEDLSLLWAQTLSASGHLSLVDIDATASRVVAVGTNGEGGVRVELSADGIVRDAMQFAGVPLRQVQIDGSVERIVGTQGGQMAVGTWDGVLALSRLPFHPATDKGRALVPDGSAIVANNIGTAPLAADLTDVFVAPLNADGRPACGGAWERFEGTSFAVMADGVDGVPLGAGIMSFEVRTVDESGTALDMCPMPAP